MMSAHAVHRAVHWALRSVDDFLGAVVFVDECHLVFSSHKTVSRLIKDAIPSYVLLFSSSKKNRPRIALRGLMVNVIGSPATDIASFARSCFTGRISLRIPTILRRKSRKHEPHIAAKPSKVRKCETFARTPAAIAFGILNAPLPQGVGCTSQPSMRAAE